MQVKRITTETFYAPFVQSTDTLVYQVDIGTQRGPMTLMLNEADLTKLGNELADFCLAHGLNEKQNAREYLDAELDNLYRGVVKSTEKRPLELAEDDPVRVAYVAATVEAHQRFNAKMKELEATYG